MNILNVLFGTVLATAFGSVALSASSPQSVANAGEPTTVKIPQRFEFYIRQGLPPEYRGKINPNKEPTVPIVIKGADIYNARCSSCHGLMGFGNGVAAGQMRTRPADLAWSLSDPKVKDDFLYWTIADGGAQFGSSMPGYKKDLTEPQIWYVVTYMRAAFEGREASRSKGTMQASIEGR